MKLGMIALVMSIMGLTQAVETTTETMGVYNKWPEMNTDVMHPAFLS